MNANQKALEGVEYIHNLEFHSFAEFVEKAHKDGMWNNILKYVGSAPAYLLVCEKLGVQPDEETLDSLWETEN